MFKDVRVEVYTVWTSSASGLFFFNNNYEGMPIKRRKNAGCEDAGLPEQRDQCRLVEGVQYSVPNSLSESPQVVKDDMSLRAKFILVRSAQMSAIEH